MNRRGFPLTTRALLLSIQFVGVATLTGVVGWPQYRPAPRPVVWFVNGPAVPAPGAVLQDARVRAAQDAAIRRQRASFGTFPDGTRGSAASSSNPTSVDQALQTPGTSDDAEQLRLMGARSNALVGRAVTDTGQKVPYARLVLRNTFTGQIEARVVADQNGNFTFTDVLPSGYVVEMVGSDGSVLASSGVVGMTSGDLKQTTIRITGNSTMRAIFGNVLPTTPTAPDTVNPVVNAGSGNVNTPVATNSPSL